MPRLDRSAVSSPNAIAGVAILAVLLLAVGVRVQYLGYDGFWYDELLTAEFMTGRGDVARDLPDGVTLAPPPDSTRLDDAPAPWAIWTHLEATVHPPLYYIAVRLWASVVGSGDVALRAWSMFCGVLGVAVLWDLVRRHQGPVAATFAAAMMALAGPQIYFSHEARHYAQGVLCLLLAAWAGWPTADRGPIGWHRIAAMSTMLLAAMLTHYFTAGAALAIAGGALWRTDRAGRRRVVLAVSTAAVVFLVTWGPQFLRQLDDGFATTSWIPVNKRPIAQTSWHLAMLPLGMFVYSRVLPAWLLAVSWSLWLVPLVRQWRWGTFPARRDLLPWVTWFPLAILPALLLEIIDGREVLAYPRYTVFAAPALFALVACMLSDHPRRWLRWLLPAGATLMCAVELTRPYVEPFPDFRPFAEHIAQNAEPGDALVIVRHPDVPWWHTGLYRSASRYALDGRIASLTIQTSDMTPRLGEAGRLWVVTPGGVRGPRPADGVLLATEGFPPAASVQLFKAPSSTDTPTAAGDHDEPGR